MREDEKFDQQRKDVAELIDSLNRTAEEKPPTHADCANYSRSQAACLEWRCHVFPDGPVCSRYLPKVGGGKENLDFRSMIHREIPPKKPTVIERPKLSRPVNVRPLEKPKKEDVTLKNAKGAERPSIPYNDPETRDKVLDMLLNQGMSQRKISEKLGEPPWKTNRRVLSAVKDGVIRRIDTGQYEWANRAQQEAAASSEVEEDVREDTVAEAVAMETQVEETAEKVDKPVEPDQLQQIVDKLAELERRCDQVRIAIEELDSRVATRLNTMAELLKRLRAGLDGHDDQLEVLSTQTKHLADEIGKLWARANEQRLQEQRLQGSHFPSELLHISAPAFDATLTHRLLNLLEAHMKLLAERTGSLAERGGAA